MAHDGLFFFLKSAHKKNGVLYLYAEKLNPKGTFSLNFSLNWPSGKAFVLYEENEKRISLQNDVFIEEHDKWANDRRFDPCIQHIFLRALLTIKSNSKLCSNLYALLFFCMSYTCILLCLLTLDDFDFKPRRVSGLYHVHAKPTNAVQMEFKCARVFFRVR